MKPADATPQQHSSFYRFTVVEDPCALADAVRQLAQPLGLTGSIVVAHEGISGAVAAAPAALQVFEAGLQQPPFVDGRLQGMAFKHSPCQQAPFGRLKVSVKPEIVALGLPAATAGQASDNAGLLSPAAWRAALQQPGVVVLDNRNHFEYRLGHFQGAQDPGVHNFRDFAAYVEQHAPAWAAAGRPVAMYCTGGIRCEKTAPWMRSLGLQVLQLEGGILNYFAQLPDAHLEWQGECFVFDNRLALNTQLQPTTTTAEAVFDATHPDEAWRLERARRLQSSGDGG